MDNEPGEDDRRLLAGTIEFYLDGLTESVERCMHCGFCNSVCPTSRISSAYKETRTSRGRAILFQGVLTGERGPSDPLSDDIREEIEYCLGCGRCETVCPVEISMPLLVGAYKEAYRKVHGERLDEAMISRFRTLAARFPGLHNVVVESKVLRSLLGLGERAPVLKATGRPRISSSERGDLLLLADPYTWVLEPRTVEAIASLVMKLGHEVEILGPIDHGMILLDLGYLDRLREHAAELVKQVEERARGRDVLVISPATYYMFRHVYPALLGSRVEGLSSTIIDVYRLFLDEYKGGGGGRGDIVYHESCLSVSNRRTASILRALEGAGYGVEGILRECCGLGGIWGIRRRSEGIARELVERFKAEARKVVREGTILVSESEACRLQIGELIPGVKVVHPASLLLLALE